MAQNHDMTTTETRQEILIPDIVIDTPHFDSKSGMTTLATNRTTPWATSMLLAVIAIGALATSLVLAVAVAVGIAILFVIGLAARAANIVTGGGH